jgi:hypothetical protein
MERRDLIMDEIKALGKALGQVLASILGTDNTKPEEDDQFASISQTMQTKLKINLDDFLGLSYGEVKPYLKSRGFMPVHLESLSEILLESAKVIESEDPARARDLYRRTLDIYSLMDTSLDAVSLERFQKEDWIRQRLDE